MDELLAAINQTVSPRIVVLGDLILDHYIRGSVSRISPEAPIPVLHVTSEEHKLGGAANVAANIVSMGGQAHLIGVIGDDAHGKALCGLCRRMKGVSISPVVVDDRPTILKTRMVAQVQQMLRVDVERSGALPRKVEDALLAALKKAFKGASLLILSDYGKGVLSDRVCREAISLAEKSGVSVLVDPKGRDYSKYSGATAITPNKGEAEAATAIDCNDEKSVEQALRTLRDGLGLQTAFITLGAGGVAVLGDDDRVVRIRAEARSVFDVTGAGDTFIATLGTFMAQGLAAPVAARLANTAAGIKVGRFGASAIAREELRRAVLAAHEAFDYHAKIVSARDLTAIAKRLRAAGRRVVFTNGCFDILHAGHVTYLNFAKQQGDVLVLGLNSDASVRRQNKGPDRPVNSQEDRARVLAALADVDFIAVFDDATPAKLIAAVKPDVLVKGEDWRGKAVAGAEVVEANGGKVVFAPLLEGRSTTSTIRKMRATS